MATQAFCSGWLESGDSPSIVVTFLLATSESCVWHERTALPSMCTVQAPHNPAPQPNFVPVSLRCSRTIQRSGVSASASTLAGLPLIVKATVVMSTSPSFGARADMACELFAPRSLKATRFLNVRISDVLPLLVGEF